MIRVGFVTGTRADFGKLKALISACLHDSEVQESILITGMHLLPEYGETWREVRRLQANILQMETKNPITMTDQLIESLEHTDAFLKSELPDLLVVHGDRVEALGAAAAAAFRNVPVAHIEGGEVSGTIDDSLRHAITKLSHVHLVSNARSAQRLRQLGEDPDTIHVMGSPDLDSMEPSTLPSLQEVRQHYGLDEEPHVLLLLHPVTTNPSEVKSGLEALIPEMELQSESILCIGPNSDEGSAEIRNALQALGAKKRNRYFASLRFEYFLRLLETAQYLIGNSSTGIKEAPYYGTPSIDLGTRQRNRGTAQTIIHSNFSQTEIASSINRAKSLVRTPSKSFGDGSSAYRFIGILRELDLTRAAQTKQFFDLSDLL